MKVKIISLAVLSLGVCGVAMASEYKAPMVGFKKTAPSHKETKAAEFHEEYKVEGAVNTDRQIASEKDSSDREPSSLVAQEKKKVMENMNEDKKTEEKFEPKPWLYRNKLDSAH